MGVGGEGFSFHRQALGVGVIGQALRDRWEWEGRESTVT